jgi:hypothetical protein
VKRKKKANKPSRPEQPDTQARPKMVRVELRQVEITAGHDGLLRGKPEPVILLFAYCVDFSAAGATSFLGGVVARLHPRTPFPCQLSVGKDGTVAMDVRRVCEARETDGLLILALALEEDSSSDVQRLYQRLAEPRSIFLWDSHAPIPAPVTIATATTWTDRRGAQVFSVHVMDGVHDLAEECGGDTWIGAQAVVTGYRQRDSECRLRFVSANQRNDWTALIAIHS